MFGTHTDELARPREAKTYVKVALVVNLVVWLSIGTSMVLFGLFATSFCIELRLWQHLIAGVYVKPGEAHSRS